MLSQKQTKDLKFKLRTLIGILSKGEYNVMTANGGDTYTFVDIESHKTIHEISWLELCIDYIPKKLGISHLIIPLNDEFNLIEYLLDVYDDKVNRKKEIIIPESSYLLDGTH